MSEAEASAPQTAEKEPLAGKSLLLLFDLLVSLNFADLLVSLAREKPSLLKTVSAQFPWLNISPNYQEQDEFGRHRHNIPYENIAFIMAANAARCTFFGKEVRHVTQHEAVFGVAGVSALCALTAAGESALYNPPAFDVKRDEKSTPNTVVGGAILQVLVGAATTQFPMNGFASAPMVIKEMERVVKAFKRLYSFESLEKLLVVFCPPGEGQTIDNPIVEKNLWKVIIQLADKHQIHNTFLGLVKNSGDDTKKLLAKLDHALRSPEKLDSFLEEHVDDPKKTFTQLVLAGHAETEWKDMETALDEAACKHAKVVNNELMSAGLNEVPMPSGDFGPFTAIMLTFGKDMSKSFLPMLVFSFLTVLQRSYFVMKHAGVSFDETVSQGNLIRTINYILRVFKSFAEGLHRTFHNNVVCTVDRTQNKTVRGDSLIEFSTEDSLKKILHRLALAVDSSVKAQAGGGLTGLGEFLDSLNLQEIGEAMSQGAAWESAMLYADIVEKEASDAKSEKAPPHTPMACQDAIHVNWDASNETALGETHSYMHRLIKMQHLLEKLEMLVHTATRKDLPGGDLYDAMHCPRKFEPDEDQLLSIQQSIDGLLRASSDSCDGESTHETIHQVCEQVERFEELVGQAEQEGDSHDDTYVRHFHKKDARRREYHRLKREILKGVRRIKKRVRSMQCQMQRNIADVLMDLPNATNALVDYVQKQNTDSQSTPSLQVLMDIATQSADLRRFVDVNFLTRVFGPAIADTAIIVLVQSLHMASVGNVFDAAYYNNPAVEGLPLKVREYFSMLGNRLMSGVADNFADALRLGPSHMRMYLGELQKLAARQIGDNMGQINQDFSWDSPDEDTLIEIKMLKIGERFQVMKEEYAAHLHYLMENDCLDEGKAKEQAGEFFQTANDYFAFNLISVFATTGPGGGTTLLGNSPQFATPKELLNFRDTVRNQYGSEQAPFNLLTQPLITYLIARYGVTPLVEVFGNIGEADTPLEEYEKIIGQPEEHSHFQRKLRDLEEAAAQSVPATEEPLHEEARGPILRTKRQIFELFVA